MHSFNNTNIAFQHFSNKDLRKSLRVFKLVSRNWLLNLGKPFLMLAIKLHIPVGWALRGVYNQFVGGKTLSNALPVMHKLAEADIKSIPDYSVEGQDNDASFENTATEIKKTIRFAAQNRNLVPFAVFKPTGISSFALLEKKSSNTTMNLNELENWDKTVQRWDSIFALAAEMSVSVMVDAEESWIQKAVDDLIFDFSLKYNHEKPVVFNTLQMYRRDRLDFLKYSISFGQKNNIRLGFKLVRGAYWEKENKYAQAHNLPSAVWQQKGETDKTYNEAIACCVKNIDAVAFMCASHNEASNALAAELAEKANIKPSDSRLWFAQLYGMGNHISYNLAASGYNVAKYLPYAPLRKVMPYLIRRAEENSSVKGQTLRELSILKEEIHRRLN
ncbi:MAG: proline dehydrogenase [Bacteroidetes bacterium HGW-Bacteroidetes-6]|jgi:proline dehydrogenase|nr:MAG: proline dehydrogenase [Bacteroidetes bacterium HGW-Bacteroidetes-6]